MLTLILFFVTALFVVGLMLDLVVIAGRRARREREKENIEWARLQAERRAAKGQGAGRRIIDCIVRH